MNPGLWCNIATFINRVACDVVLLIETVLLFTGIYMFRPPIVLRLLGDDFVEAAGLTTQGFWQSSIYLVVVLLLCCRAIKFLYNSERLCSIFPAFLIPLSIAALIVLGTKFDSDKMILSFLLWFAIKVITQSTIDRINIQRNIFANVNKDEEIEWLLQNEKTSNHQ